MVEIESVFELLLRQLSERCSREFYFLSPCYTCICLMALTCTCRVTLRIKRVLQTRTTSAVFFLIFISYSIVISYMLRVCIEYVSKRCTGFNLMHHREKNYTSPDESCLHSCLAFHSFLFTIKNKQCLTSDFERNIYDNDHNMQ